MAEYGDVGVRYDPPGCGCSGCITGKSLPDRRSGEQATTVRWRSGLEQRGRVRTAKVEALCWCWESPCICDGRPEATIDQSVEGSEDADREPVAYQMRAVADWCAAHVGEIPAQIKTRAPGEMESMLHWLADYIEGKREDVRDLFIETPDALEEMARHFYYSSHDRPFTEAIAEIEAKLLPLYARIYARKAIERHEGGEHG